MRFKLLLRLLSIVLFSTSLASCGVSGKLLGSTTSSTLTIVTSADLNPDRDGRASPLIIKVFALADDRQFKREDFLSLYENPPERLGSDLLNSFELKEFSPDESRDETIALSPETKFIGLLAEYVQYDRAKALLILPVSAHKNNKYTIKAQHLGIAIADD